ncbi:MAG TPA: hypothetical protein VMF55_12275 [Solirubrobacterales bacterium]|nr:hypothetical protein [Solirubrobacterales bacterium]
MNTHAPTTIAKSLIATAALAAVTLLALLALSGSPAAAAKPKSYECQHPLITGQEAVNPKGISPKEACKVVRELGVFLEKPANIKKLYECKGETKQHPGRPKLLMTEFNGWKLKLVNGYSFFMTKPGQSFRVTGQDFPVNCS